jgi:peptidoglycan/xylan/chitin deacetylase (PgdA/CDA1 family)
MSRLLLRISTVLIALVLIFTLFVGDTATKTSAQVITSNGTQASSVQPVQTKKCVIFRDDDIGAGSLNTLQAINQVHIDENVPVTLAIIPHMGNASSGNELLTEPLLSFLQSIKGDPLFELALHGYTHHNNAPKTGGAVDTRSEFRGQPYADQFNAIKQGRDDIIEALGVTPTTFVPPFNKGDDNTLKAATALGFMLYSTSQDDFGVQRAHLQGITVQALTFGLGWKNDSFWDWRMSNLTKYTEAALDAAGPGDSIVICYHHGNFGKPDGSPDLTNIALFRQYVEHLKSRGDVLFTTLDNQNALPHSAKTQLNLTASSAIVAVNQPVFLTATLTRFDPATHRPVAAKSGTPVQIWHTLNGVRYNDTTIDTDGNGQITYLANWTELGELTYYASFPGDNVYIGSISSPLTINVSDQMPASLEAWGFIPQIS